MKRGGQPRGVSSGPGRAAVAGRVKRSAREPDGEAERVYGLAAALAAFEQRPEAVVSIAHTAEVRRPIAPMLREAARRRIAYREVEEPELGKLADSVHHEGVCLLVRPRRPLDSGELIERVAERGLLLAFDDVQNPHNIGAMLRSAAYFGVCGAILSERLRPKLSAAARRVAEGGAEHVPVAIVPALAPALRELADAGFGVVGADARARLPLAELSWPKRAVLVLGHERTGLSSETRAACRALTRIDGTDAVDSLNVSVAAGVLMASYAQRHGFGP
jgi:RNA methyltransferase, TrmH family